MCLVLRAHRVCALPVLFAALTLFFAADSANAAPAFTIVDLGSLGGTETFAAALNDSGQVVGYSTLAGGETPYAFRTPPNSPITPASMLGPGIATGINASGQVVGRSSLGGFRTEPNGVITPQSYLTTPAGTSAHIGGINNSGQAVGLLVLAENGFGLDAFRTAPNGHVTVDTDLGNPGMYGSSASAINASGQVAGSISLDDEATHAFRMAAGATQITLADDLHTAASPGNSWANAINASGRVVGTFDIPGNTDDQHAFRTTATGKIEANTDLGKLGGRFSEAYAINSAGQVVGYSETDDRQAEHAFFVDVSGSMLDLNNLIPPGKDHVLEVASGINDNGQIIANGRIDGESHAFLLTPARPGDVTGDGKIDFADLVTLAQHYGAPGEQTWWTGDFDGDGIVGFTDLVQLAQNYEPNPASSASADLASVPEPAGAMVLSVAGISALSLSRRRARSDALA